jgi:uncharacterized membrane protein
MPIGAIDPNVCPMTTFEHAPHQRVTHREPPAQSTDEYEKIGFNGRLGAAITRGVGTMWAFYIAAAFMAGWMLLSEAHLISFDPYPYPFLLFLGNIVQLLLMFVILVGQQVLSRASDKRAVQTYQDAEAILHECLELQRHLTVQDRSLDSLITRMEQFAEKTAPGTP